MRYTIKLLRKSTKKTMKNHTRLFYNHAYVNQGYTLLDGKHYISLYTSILSLK